MREDREGRGRGTEAIPGVPDAPTGGRVPVVTALLALASFAAGLVAFVAGLRAGHGEGTLYAHLAWGTGALFLQGFTAVVAAMHARARSREIQELFSEIERLEQTGATAPPIGTRGGGTAA